MKEAKASMEEKEKVKYFLRALPTNYKSKFILDSNITVDSLYNKIKEDLKLWNYFNNLGNTTKEETHDDPMDIDYAGKFKGKGKQNRRINKTQNKLIIYFVKIKFQNLIMTPLTLFLNRK